MPGVLENSKKANLVGTELEGRKEKLVRDEDREVMGQIM